MQKTAEAKLFAKQQEAQGIKKIYAAQAEGLQKLVQAFSNPQMAIQYLMLEKGLYQQLAAENAKAIQGLKPKFNIWTTGKSGEGDCMKPMRDIFNTLPPLLSTVQNQTMGKAAPAPTN
jgi:flotillin